MESFGIGIAGTAYVIPGDPVPIERWTERHGISQERLAALRANGVVRYVDSYDAPLIELAEAATKKLLADERIAPESVDVLIFAHTRMISIAPPPGSFTGELAARCGMRPKSHFSLYQQNCVSPIAAIRIARSMMAQDPALERVVIVAADVLYRINDTTRVIGDTAVNSDAAAALLLEREPASGRILAIANFAEARHYLGQIAAPEHLDDFYIRMIGLIRRVTSDANLPTRSIGCILPNHSSLPAWKKLTKLLRLPEQALFEDNFGRIGHTFGCDGIINLTDRRRQKTGETVLLFANGLAGCFGAVLLQT